MGRASVEATTTTGKRLLLDDSHIQELKRRLHGPLLLAHDAGYEDARKVWNGMVDKRPALVARCAGVADVVSAVRFARDHDLLVSVRGGGHNIAGKAVCEGGLMIDLSQMRAVQVDSVRKTARVEGGATLAELDQNAQTFGLATPAGVVSHTGVAGLTLGGGIGRIARKYGLACDNLLSAELVLANGELVRASGTENPDLFWGLRGGGGNFGIVTSFEFRLHAVGPTVLGGVVIYPFEKAREILAFYARFSRAAPDELAVDAILLTSPEGKKVVALSTCYIGAFEEGERVLEPLRRLGPPLADQIGRVSYVELQRAADAFFPTGLLHYWKTHLLTEMSHGAIDATVRAFEDVPSTRSIIVFQQYGGAVSRVNPSATAFRHRDAQYDFIPTSIWEEPADSQTHMAWVRRLWESMKPFSSGAEYVNNLGDEGEDRVRAAFGDHYGRLAALKKKYDPTNFFRLNANIKPAA